MMQEERWRFLRDGLTIGGRRTVLDETRTDNWMRVAASATQTRLLGVVANGADDPTVLQHRWVEVLLVADALIATFDNPIHYGDSRPGMFSAAGRPLVPDARFSFWNLWDLGVTGPDGFHGFLRDCDLPTETNRETVLTSAGMLLVDEAINSLDKGGVAFAGYLLQQAQDCAGEATLWILDQAAPAARTKGLQAFLSARGRQAGVSSGNVRREQAKASQPKVQAELDRLRRAGTTYSDRDINGVIARKLGVSTDHIRKVRKKLSTLNPD